MTRARATTAAIVLCALTAPGVGGAQEIPIIDAILAQVEDVEVNWIPWAKVDGTRWAQPLRGFLLEASFLRARLGCTNCPPDPTPHALRITAQPWTTTGTQEFLSPIVVKVMDQKGRPFPAEIEIRVTALPANGGLEGAMRQESDEGTATFRDLRLTRPGTYRLLVTADGLHGDTTILVTASSTPPPAAQLVVATEPPARTRSGARLSPIVVELWDSMRVLLPSAEAVTAQLIEGSGTLGGTTMVRAASGIARFENLVVTGHGPHRIRFLADQLRPDTSIVITLAADSLTGLTRRFRFGDTLETLTHVPTRPPVREREANFTGEVAVGFGQLANLRTRYLGFDLRGSLIDVPAVTGYLAKDVFGDAVSPYIGLRLGLTNLSGFRAYLASDTLSFQAYEAAGTAPLFGFLAGIAIELDDNVLLFGEASYISRYFRNVRWGAAKDTLPQSLPRELRLSTQNLAIGLQFELKKK